MTSSLGFTGWSNDHKIHFAHLVSQQNSRCHSHIFHYFCHVSKNDTVETYFIRRVCTQLLKLHVYRHISVNASRKRILAAYISHFRSTLTQKWLTSALKSAAPKHMVGWGLTALLAYTIQSCLYVFSTQQIVRWYQGTVLKSHYHHVTIALITSAHNIHNSSLRNI